jgi:hypothetical protein
LFLLLLGELITKANTIESSAGKGREIVTGMMM